jgi:predicted DNA-binding transcriptional regulator AlpA
MARRETRLFPQKERKMTIYCDTPQAAQKLGLSTSKMNKMRHFGTGPEFVKFGRAVRYADDALEAYAEARRRTCTRDEPAAA